MNLPTLGLHALGLHDLGLFALTVLLVNATPGVDLLFTVTRTLQQGVRGGLAAAAGICFGCVGHALAAAFGLAALMAASAAAFDALRWAGAAYLLWLAAGMLRSAWRSTGSAPGGAAPLPVEPRAGTLGATFRQGLLANLLNPKVAIFFLALLPQFIDADAPHKTLAFLALGAWFVLQGGLFLCALVLAVAPLRRWQPAAGVRRAFEGAAAALFVGLAARLAFAARP